MEGIKLSKKGVELIKLYEEMAVKGVKRKDGHVNDDYASEFNLKKFRYICKDLMSSEKIKTVLVADFIADNFFPTYHISSVNLFTLNVVILV